MKKTGVAYFANEQITFFVLSSNGITVCKSFMNSKQYFWVWNF